MELDHVGWATPLLREISDRAAHIPLHLAHHNDCYLSAFLTLIFACGSFWSDFLNPLVVIYVFEGCFFREIEK